MGSEGLIHGNVICDRQQLIQALTNILGNALKFTPPGGRISLCLTESTGAPAGYGFYIFKIRDTGIGMSKELLEHLFELFDRAKSVSASGVQSLSSPCTE